MATRKIAIEMPEDLAAFLDRLAAASDRADAAAVLIDLTRQLKTAQDEARALQLAERPGVVTSKMTSGS
ncbi:hypothetical protein [Jannaschia sp. M317]|uniref:hypothetical protein n=1 Tax=Jannaschia sp. M317 TaxID=2867011 RepID=UPI0021A8E3BF|nr:hypothetical protein [Jannaschia sp. M317]UWQ19169.1 hypothetical protein K3551_07830 [Jannaschia sp. M317]